MRQWVPYLCHYLLAVVLVFFASADAMYMVQKAMDGVLTLNWPLKVRPETINPHPHPPKPPHPQTCKPPNPRNPETPKPEILKTPNSIP